MIRLTGSRYISAFLGGAAATTNPSVVVCYADKGNEATGPFQTSAKATAMNGSNTVVICTAPSAAVQRDIDFIAVRNNDTASVTVTINYVDGFTTRVLRKVTLATLEQLFYSSTAGWYCMTADGRLKWAVGQYTWTPNITAGSGSITTVSATGVYSAWGRERAYTVDIVITANGTGGSNLRFDTPFTSPGIAPFSGFETAVTGLPLGGYLLNTTGIIYTPTGAYPGGDGRRVVVRGTCYV